jgi:hypothetical protein
MDEQFIAISTFRIQETRLYFFSTNTLDIHWRRKWPKNWIENLAYGNGVLVLVPEDNDQTQDYAVIEVLNVETK